MGTKLASAETSRSNGQGMDGSVRDSQADSKGERWESAKATRDCVMAEKKSNLFGHSKD